MVKPCNVMCYPCFPKATLTHNTRICPPSEGDDTTSRRTGRHAKAHGGVSADVGVLISRGGDGSGALLISRVLHAGDVYTLVVIWLLCAGDVLVRCYITREIYCNIMHQHDSIIQYHVVSL